MTNYAIDWSEASVADDTLTAPVTPEPAKGWRRTAETVTAELRNASAQWPTVRVKKTGFDMDDVGDLAPADVRFFLESVVQQANAGEPVGDDEGEGEGDDPDSRLTGAYRTFAG